MSDAPTITGFTVRVVNPPLATPHATAGGLVASFPMLLADLKTDAGIVGHAYVFTYSMTYAPSIARLVRDLAPLVVGQPCRPAELHAALRKRFRLIGPHGFTTIALALIDMAAWDVACRAANEPLYKLLGGERRGTRGYAPVGQSGRAGARREAEAGVAAGFRAVKAKIGYATVDEDASVVGELRAAVGTSGAVMVDYNQSLSVDEAIARCRALDALGLGWIEEPTIAEDFAGHARIRYAVETPIQAGENWWGPLEFRNAVAAGATDRLMPDVMKIGGITPWAEVAQIASDAGLAVSSHLFPEVSAHLLAATPNAEWLEWCDWSNPVIAEPPVIADGKVWPSQRPGIGIEWNEAAVERYLEAA
ncbi:MAG: hypothetical protein AD742_03770 [Methylibium sp. NZG]|nr:MAG: hypothetical protein AD742_03770 [Methylibium sp. NZG]